MKYKDFFSRQARKPTGLFGKFFMSRVFDKGNADLISFMKELMQVKEADRILEIGFGTGSLIYELAALVPKGFIEGIDLSETMVSMARKKNRNHIKAGLVNICQGRFEDNSYAPESFDKICTANTIYFWTDPETSVKEAARILSPGGMFAIGFGDKEELEKRDLSREVFSLYSLDEVKSMLMENGFRGAGIFSQKGEPFTLHCAVAIK